MEFLVDHFRFELLAWLPMGPPDDGEPAAGPWWMYPLVAGGFLLFCIVAGILSNVLAHVATWITLAFRPEERKASRKIPTPKAKFGLSAQKRALRKDGFAMNRAIRKSPERTDKDQPL